MPAGRRTNTSWRGEPPGRAGRPHQQVLCVLRQPPVPAHPPDRAPDRPQEARLLLHRRRLLRKLRLPPVRRLLHPLREEHLQAAGRGTRSRQLRVRGRAQSRVAQHTKRGRTGADVRADTRWWRLLGIDLRYGRIVRAAFAVVAARGGGRAAAESACGSRGAAAIGIVSYWCAERRTRHVRMGGRPDPVPVQRVRHRLQLRRPTQASELSERKVAGAARYRGKQTGDRRRASPRLVPREHGLGEELPVLHRVPVVLGESALRGTRMCGGGAFTSLLAGADRGEDRTRGAPHSRPAAGCGGAPSPGKL